MKCYDAFGELINLKKHKSMAYPSAPPATASKQLGIEGFFTSNKKRKIQPTQAPAPPLVPPVLPGPMLPVPMEIDEEEENLAAAAADLTPAVSPMEVD